MPDKPMSQEQRRSLYKNPQMVHDNYFLGVLVFIEMHRRIHKGNFGEVPKPIRDDAFSMGGYCLDAPETMPAGSMVYESFGPGRHEWLFVPSTIQREES